jgi:hypothetical protein
MVLDRILLSCHLNLDYYRDQLVTSPILNGDRGSRPSEMSDTSEGGYAGEI